MHGCLLVCRFAVASLQPKQLSWLTDYRVYNVFPSTSSLAPTLLAKHVRLCGACARARRPDSSAGDLQERLSRDAELQRVLAVSQRVGRLLLKAEAGELALVDELAAELLQNEYRCAPHCSCRRHLTGPGSWSLSASESWHCCLWALDAAQLLLPGKHLRRAFVV